MGKASSRKKMRRERGFTKRSLSDARRLVNLADSMGGIVQVVAGTDGVHIHFTVIEVGAQPSALCGPTLPLKPTGTIDETFEVTCPQCMALPERFVRDTMYAARQTSREISIQQRRALEEMGG